MSKYKSYAIVMLAAGSSSRLGRPKQLIPWGEQMLIKSMLEICHKSRADELYTVLGFEHERVASHIDRGHILYNHDWQSGMSSSIVLAVDNLQHVGYDGIVLCTCDQYMLTHHILNDIFEEANRGASIVVSKYNEGTGPPAYFSKIYYPYLLALGRNETGKSIIRQNLHDVKYIDFKLGHLDIDIPSDLDEFNRQINI